MIRNDVDIIAQLNAMLSGIGSEELTKDWQDYPLLDDQGRLRPMPVQFWLDKGYIFKRSFLHFKSQYFLPTVESLAFINHLIGDISKSHCLEIGAGNGWLGWQLGIRMTDSYLQTRPDINRNYEMVRQPTIQYGKTVEKIDALSAVKKHRPHTVLASWVSSYGNPPIGNPNGVDEIEMMQYIKRYIFIGTDTQHSHKPLIKTGRFKKYRVPGLISRAKNDEDNAVWVFENRKETSCP